jgi:hypothetical protein
MAGLSIGIDHPLELAVVERLLTVKDTANVCQQCPPFRKEWEIHSTDSGISVEATYQLSLRLSPTVCHRHIMSTARIDRNGCYGRITGHLTISARLAANKAQRRSHAAAVLPIGAHQQMSE